MECHTCQNLYHQECHDPVITDEEALDPRLIWNCSTCKPVQQTTVINSKINQPLKMKWVKSRWYELVFVYCNEPAFSQDVYETFIFSTKSMRCMDKILKNVIS